MSTNPISLFVNSKFVSQLYSLTGPQENLPALLCNLLGNEEVVVRQKLRGETSFSAEDLEKINNKFNCAALHYQMIA